MRRYEYRCRECDATVELAEQGHEGDRCPATTGCTGTLRRVWGFGIAWPHEARGHG